MENKSTNLRPTNQRETPQFLLSESRKLPNQIPLVPHGQAASHTASGVEEKDRGGSSLNFSQEHKQLSELIGLTLRDSIRRKLFPDKPKGESLKKA